LGDFPRISLPRVTALPSAPADGFELVYIADDTNGVEWHLKYKSSETTYKWRVLAGPPLFAEVTTDESTSSTTYTALTTAGPSITLPLTGDYDIDHGALIWATLANTGVSMSYDIGGTGASDNDRAYYETQGSGGDLTPVISSRRKTGLTAVTLTSKYKTNAGTAHIQRRWIRARPVRVA